MYWVSNVLVWSWPGEKVVWCCSCEKLASFGLGMVVWFWYRCDLGQGRQYTGQEVVQFWSSEQLGEERFGHGQVMRQCGVKKVEHETVSSEKTICLQSGGKVCFFTWSGEKLMRY